MQAYYLVQQIQEIQQQLQMYEAKHIDVPMVAYDTPPNCKY